MENENKPYQAYICPKCKAEICSRIPLVYCTCGGKYETPVERLIRETYGYPKNVFKDIF